MSKEIFAAGILTATIGVAVPAAGDEPASSGDRTALGIFAAAAGMDAVTTYRNLTEPPRVTANGLHRVSIKERNPLLSWMDDKPALMITVGAGADALAIHWWRKATRNRPALRRAGIYAAAAARFGLAYRNHRVLAEMRKR